MLLGKPGDFYLNMDSENYKLISSTFKNKRVFITGHTGFKGSWFIFWLHSLGAKICGYSLEPLKQEDIFNKIKSADLCENIFGDIRDISKLEKSILNFEPDFVFHFAAQPIVIKSYKNPIDTISTNVLGTANLLNSLEKLAKKCSAILITTDKVYDNKDNGRIFKEDDKLGGYDPYSSSKACSEIIISSFRESYFNINNYDNHQKSIAVARAGNVIGGGDWSDYRLIPDIIKSLYLNKSIVIRNPLSIRPWQHVLDPLYGYLLLAAKLYNDPINYSEAWNFGPKEDEIMSVEEVAQLLIKNWGEGNITLNNDAKKVHESSVLRLDIQKAVLKLDWTPRWNVEESISFTVNWYKHFKLGTPVANLIENDINDYLRN